MPHTPDRNSDLVWPPALLDLPESVWEMTPDGPRARIRVAGCALTLTGLAVRTDNDGVQSAADTARESLLLDLYDPGEPWQTWRGFGAEHAVYATPAADQDSPVAADVVLDRSAWTPWSGLAPELEEPDRKLLTMVIHGHCALHLDARRVTGPDQEFLNEPGDRAALAQLAGWDGPYPTVRIDDHEYVLFAYPHGD